MSSESKQWLLEVVLLILTVIALASAPARGTSRAATLGGEAHTAATSSR
jgi:hypothetical protein